MVAPLSNILEAGMSVLLKANLLDLGELGGCVGSPLSQDMEGLWPIGNKKQRSAQ